MSHFCVLAILDKEQAEDVQGSLDDLMAPYSENKDVEEYDHKCYCVGGLARKAAQSAAQETLKVTWDGLRDEFHKAEEALPEKERDDWGGRQKRWKLKTRFLVEMTDKLERSHFQYQKPDPTCDECKGTGLYKSTYNPDSKWDWWSIGGRWTGDLTDYDPSIDPKNIEICDLCMGSGIRKDEIGNKERQRDPAYTCNGCSGKGKRVKWPTEWASFEGDVQPMSNIKEGYTPFAILTPEGEWIEKGKMGWWGMTTDEQDENAWEAICKTVLKKYRTEGHIGVVVDCHI